MKNSETLGNGQNPTNQCGVCGGTGKVWMKSKPNPDSFVHDEAGDKPCHSCRGTGESSDRLRKVMAMGKPDLLK